MPLVRKPRITIQDEGTAQGRASTVNFVGSAVAATLSDDVATATITGGSSSGVEATTVEVDLGSSPVFEGRFTITNAAITAASKILCWQAPGPYTGKGTRADEAAMQPVKVTAVEPGTGSAIVYWQTPPTFTFVPAGLSGGGGGKSDSTAVPSGRRSEHDPIIVDRLGMVRGNIKFTYIVL